jgi:hypothetical protein
MTEGGRPRIRSGRRAGHSARIPSPPCYGWDTLRGVTFSIIQQVAGGNGAGVAVPVAPTDVGAVASQTLINLAHRLGTPLMASAHCPRQLRSLPRSVVNVF